MSWLNLEDKVAVVTGGACGIGRACCEGLAEVGVRLVVADIDEAGAEKVAASMKDRFGREHIATNTDVSSKTSVDSNCIGMPISQAHQLPGGRWGHRGWANVSRWRRPFSMAVSTSSLW